VGGTLKYIKYNTAKFDLLLIQRITFVSYIT